MIESSGAASSILAEEMIAGTRKRHAGPVGADSRRARPSVAFISWSEDDGRAIEIAAALDGESRSFYDLAIVAAPLVPVRYAVSAFRTIAYLLARRPRALIVTNPPVFPAVIGLAYARLAGAPLLLDSHPSAFGSAPFSRVLMPVHRWLVRHATATLVTGEELASVVRDWGGRPEIVHEAPPRWTVAPPGAIRGRPKVLAIGRFADDEHTADVVAAACRLPEVDVFVTGDVRKCPQEILAGAPENVVFPGFLRDEAYAAAIEEADVLVVLTEHPQAVNRAAYEAVYAGRPLIISEMPAMAALFPEAISVANEGGAIAEGIRAALARHNQLRAAVPRARELQARRWSAQLRRLQEVIGLDSDEVNRC